MKLYSIDTGFFKLDGGAMFGVVPQVIWKNINPPDEKNLCTWAMRCLLVEEGDRLILVDTGLGNKQSDKFFSYYEPHGPSLDDSLKAKGFHADDITDVFLTHLHFDHCGGAIEYNKDRQLVPKFKNATYWSHKDHWEWAVNPNPREKASFLKENILPIQESGQLRYIEKGEELIPGFKIRTVDGHTEKMMLPQINYNGKTIVYLADLMPSAGHLPVPYVMAYDVRPLNTLVEKESFLKEALENDYILMFEHDKDNECCTIKNTERGARPDQFLKVSDL